MKSEIIRKTLSNGLRFVHIKNKSNNITIKVSLLCGSQNETSENNGISHFLEHMIWQGSKNYTAEGLREDLKDMNANFNASTSFKRTSHFISGPRRHYEKMLKILLDAIQDPLFDEKEIERERTVILDEYKRRLDDSGFILQKSLFKKLFGDNSLSQTVIGTEGNIKNITRDQLIDYYNKYYVSNNMIVSVSGNIDHPEELIEKYFTLKEGKIIKMQEFTKPKLNSKDITRLKESKCATFLDISFLTPEYTHKDTAIIEIINYILDYGNDINLETTIRQKLGLTYSISTNNFPLQEIGVFSIKTTTNKEKTDLVVEAVLEELKKLENLKAKELNRAKKKIIQAHKKINLIPFVFEEIVIQGDLLGYTEAYSNRPKYIQEATIEDIKRVMNEYFKNYLITIVEPREDTITSSSPL